MRRYGRRRFPDVVTRLRTSPGVRDNTGETVPGAVAEVDFPASVQPVELIDKDRSEGVLLTDRLRVYVVPIDRLGPAFGSAFGGAFDTAPGAGDGPLLAAAFDEAVADRVRYDGRLFVVEESQAWSGHTRAVLLREH